MSRYILIFCCLLLAISLQSQEKTYYKSEGYFNHPTSPRTMLLDKTLYKINDSIYYTNIGDLPVGDGKLVLNIHNDFSVSYKNSYMETGGTKYTISQTNDSTNKYDPILKKFNLHYEYTFQNGKRIIREVLTKIPLISKIVNLTSPGSLSTTLTVSELNTINDLTITGAINARDFKTMRDNMKFLEKLDISNTSIYAYTGTEGTAGNSIISYTNNRIPENAFYGSPFGTNTTLTSIKLPNSINEIGRNAFYGCSGLTGTLVIPTNVWGIHAYAFAYCRGLSGSLNLPDNISTISEGAFDNCSGLNGNLIFSSLVNTIEKYAFRGCGFTGELKLPAGLIHIMESAFQGCSGFTGSLIIPTKIQYIGASAFDGCKGFDGSLVLSPNLTTIYASAFSNCSGFTGSLILPSTISTIGESAFNNCSRFSGPLNLPMTLTTINSKTFSGCKGLTGSLKIPNFVTIIDSYAFNDCSGFNDSLSIPLSVVNIGSYAFNGCTGFSGNLSIPLSINKLGTNAFGDSISFTSIYSHINYPSSVSLEINAFGTSIKNTCSLYVPIGTKVSYEKADQWKDFEKIIDGLPATAFPKPVSKTVKLTTPGSLGTVLTTSELSTITDLKLIGEINASDFKTMHDLMPLLANINISSTVVGYIPQYAFYNKVSLKSILLPSSVTSIGSFAFYGCKGLTGTVYFPQSQYEFAEIGESAFENCTGLTGKLTLPNGLPVIRYRAFAGCTGLSEITIPSAVRWIEGSTFYGCSNLKSIYVYTNKMDGYYPDDMTKGLNTSNITLFVSTGKKSTFANHSIWNKFPNIQEGIPPILFTTSISDIFTSKATVAGKISEYDINNTMTYGVVWSENPTPEIEKDSKTSKVTTYAGAQTTVIDSLKLNTNYYVRAFAYNSAGLNYGNELTFKTKDAIQLTTTSPTVLKNKMVDGTTNATIISLGTLKGIETADINNVGFTAIASYEDANVGINKKIIVKYTLSGSEKDKYMAPKNDTILNAKISDFVTLNPIVKPDAACEGDALDLNYLIKTGIPTHYKITFGNDAKNTGLRDIAYQTLSGSGNTGTIPISIPYLFADGNYTGTLRMKNELNSESPDYPFQFTVNVSPDNIVTKFDEVILFNNISNRFTAYQWMKNGTEISGATKQYYVDPTGLKGGYSVKLTTADGKTVYTCPKMLSIFSVKAQVRAIPNPVKANEQCKIEFSGLTDEQLKKANLAVYNMQGVCIYKLNAVQSITELHLPLNGVYIGKVTGAGDDYVFKIMVTK